MPDIEGEVAHRHVNPLIIFGIAIFGVTAFYMSLVVVSQASSVFFPGNEPDLGALSVIPGVKSNEAPEVVTIEDRINILFMGLDQRRDEDDDQPYRTDSVLILTMDQFSKTAGVFSIPRDTWVEIPDGYGGYYENRINVVYENGEYSSEYDGGGAALIKDTIEHNFDIPIDHYVLLNFNNFIELIDELGGINVDIPEYAYDPEYTDCQYCSGTSYIEFNPGPEHMDGVRALAYARIRASDNDFKRIERQQVVIQATAQRAMDLGTVIPNAKDLYDKYKDSVDTDISASKAVGLALLANEIGTENMRMVSMADATFSCNICGGAAALLWNADKVEELKGRVFSDGRVQASLDGEGATVEVLNGTETPELAAEFASFLRGQGIPSAQISDRRDCRR